MADNRRSGRTAAVDRVAVYIGGYGRSGSTILEALLGGGRLLRTGELRYLGKLADAGEHCSCGLGYDVCPVWSRVLASGPADDEAIYARLWQLVAEDDGLDGIIESSKSTRGSYLRPLLARRAAREAGARFYFVHLVRHPDDVLESLRTGSNEAMRAARSARTSRWKRGLAMTVGWPASNLAAWAMRLVLGRDCYVRVRYADMLNSPALARLARESGLGAISDEADYESLNVHQVGGNRLTRKGRQAVAIKPATSTRRMLNGANRMLFAALS